MKRALTGVAIGAVALVAGVVSYTHIYDLSRMLHQSPILAGLMPFGIDGLIVVGSVVLLDGSALGWLGIGPGVAISLFANVASGLQFGTLSAVWAGIPALSFFLATFILERWLKVQAAKTTDAAAAIAADARTPDAAADAPGAFVPASEAIAPETPEADAAVAAAPAPIKAAPIKAARAPVAAKSAAGHTARTRYRDLLSKGELPSLRAIQRDMRVGAPKARVIRTELETHLAPKLAAAA